MHKTRHLRAAIYKLEQLANTALNDIRAVSPLSTAPSKTSIGIFTTTAEPRRPSSPTTPKLF